MTSAQRRAQLIEVGRSLFADKGFEAVSVEEIATAAQVSKPIVYEHFGGKEGLYAVIVDREMQALTNALISTLDDPDDHPLHILEKAALALLTYIEENSEGFRVLVRDSPSTDPTGSFSSLLGDVSTRVEDLLSATFKRHKIPVKGAPYYAQMLVGMTVFTGQYWADRQRVSKEQLAAYVVNLAWNGLSRMDAKPELRYESAAAKNRIRKEAERAAREAEKAAGKAATPASAAADGIAEAETGTGADTGTDATDEVNGADETSETDETAA
ncbi:MAG: TetR/AcrR family transcriptional regulator [Bifidobacteriaceae bacterium]|jgi:AcrR family transcriptional regulator|nr:TetR/AcrR family transcriptional regulator [Bifidobacteriaceae bacterium]MCI1915455.1 TetR/AcrR family transcriptional regulator [Bifidobacteriaceae bacterium]